MKNKTRFTSASVRTAEQVAALKRFQEVKVGVEHEALFIQAADNTAVDQNPTPGEVSIADLDSTKGAPDKLYKTSMTFDTVTGKVSDMWVTTTGGFRYTRAYNDKDGKKTCTEARLQGDYMYGGGNVLEDRFVVDSASAEVVGLSSRVKYDPFLT